MATIRKRGDLQWEAQIRKKGFPAQSRTFTYRDDAERWAKETEVAIERGLFFDRTKAERTTVSELITRYRSDIMPSLGGKHVKPALNALAPIFGEYALSSVTSEMISKYRDTRLKTVAESTVKKEINLLSKIIDLAGKEWGIPVAVNPCLNVKRPTEPNGRERRLIGTEETYLLYACSDSSQELESIVIVAIETAARLGELLELEWRHINVDKRTMKFLDTKNGDNREIPLTSRAVKIIETLKALPRHISGRVFYKWAAADSFNKTWTRACVRTGIEDLRFHDLRHEACSRLADKFHMHELMKITGHKTAAMLARYYHPRAEDLAKKLG
jgi:integrase